MRRIALDSFLLSGVREDCRAPGTDVRAISHEWADVALVKGKKLCRSIVMKEECLCIYFLLERILYNVIHMVIPVEVHNYSKTRATDDEGWYNEGDTD